MKTIGRDFGDTARKVYAVASGALGNGKACVVNTDGTVSVVSSTTITQNVATAVQFTTNEINDSFMAFDSNSNRSLLVYQDQGDSNSGHSIVAEVDPSDNSVSYGTAVEFHDGAIQDAALAFSTTDNKFLVVYRGASNHGRARVATIDSSDNSVSYGTEVVFEADTTTKTRVAYDSSNNKFVVCYTDAGNSNYGTAIVGTISGTNVSFGSAEVFESAGTTAQTIVFDSSNNKVVIAYADQGDSNKGKAIVGTVSGTSISFGTAVEFDAGNCSADFMVSAFDTGNSKVVIGYRRPPDGGGLGHGKAVVGTVSGTGISFGSVGTFQGSAEVANMSMRYDSRVGKIVVAYQGET